MIYLLVVQLFIRCHSCTYCSWGNSFYCLSTILIECPSGLAGVLGTSGPFQVDGIWTPIKTMLLFLINSISQHNLCYIGDILYHTLNSVLFCIFSLCLKYWYKGLENRYSIALIYWLIDIQLFQFYCTALFSGWLKIWSSYCISPLVLILELSDFFRCILDIVRLFVCLCVCLIWHF